MRGKGSDFSRRTLAQIPTLFGRLFYLASLRQTASGMYFHDSLTPILGDEEADRALRHTHYQVFSQWLGLSLADQKADLEEYLGSTGSPRQAYHYRHLTPPAARDVERQLYHTDLDTLLELLKFEAGVAFSNPGA